MFIARRQRRRRLVRSRTETSLTAARLYRLSCPRAPDECGLPITAFCSPFDKGKRPVKGQALSFEQIRLFDEVCHEEEQRAHVLTFVV